jgi:hypothetical protein
MPVPKQGTFHSELYFKVELFDKPLLMQCCIAYGEMLLLLLQRRCKTSGNNTREVEGFAIVYRARESCFPFSLVQVDVRVVFHSALARVTLVCNKPCTCV